MPFGRKQLPLPSSPPRVHSCLETSSTTAGTKVDSVLPQGARLVGGFRPSQKIPRSHSGSPWTWEPPRHVIPHPRPRPPLGPPPSSAVSPPRARRWLPAWSGDPLDPRINRPSLWPSPPPARSPPLLPQCTAALALCSAANLAARLCCYYQHLLGKRERTQLSLIAWRTEQQIRVRASPGIAPKLPRLPWRGRKGGSSTYSKPAS